MQVREIRGPSFGLGIEKHEEEKTPSAESRHDVAFTLLTVATDKYGGQPG